MVIPLSARSSPPMSSGRVWSTFSPLSRANLLLDDLFGTWQSLIIFEKSANQGMDGKPEEGCGERIYAIPEPWFLGVGHYAGPGTGIRAEQGLGN